MGEIFNPSRFTFDDTNPNRFISGFNSQTSVKSPYLTSDIYIDDNDVLRAKPSFDIEQNLGELNTLINAYDAITQIYHNKMRVYKGDHAVLRKHPFNKLFNEKEENMSVNIPKNMVNTFAGFFNGIPPKINYAPSTSSDDDVNDDATTAINDWLSNTLNNSHYSDVFFELGKKADIYGRSYVIAYIDSDSNVKFKDLSPEQCFIVYANNLDETPLFAVYYTEFGGNTYGTLYTPNHMYDFDPNSIENSTTLTANQSDNPFNGVIPVVEMLENDERLGIFDDAISAIDKLDKVWSLKFNDVNYFSNAILFLKGFDKLDDEQRKTISRWHILQTTDNDPNDNVSAEYLAKPQNDQQQQNFINGIVSQIYQNAQIVNLSDPEMGASASGDALGKKLQPMTMLADSKARKMSNTIKQLLAILLQFYQPLENGDINDVVANTQVKFTPNIPHSLLDESNIVKNLNGIVPRATLYSMISTIQDVNKEIELYNAEQEQNQQTAQNMSGVSGSNDDSDSGSDNDNDNSNDNNGDYPNDEDDD